MAYTPEIPRKGRKVILLWHRSRNISKDGPQSGYQISLITKKATERHLMDSLFHIVTPKNCKCRRLPFPSYHAQSNATHTP